MPGYRNKALVSLYSSHKFNEQERRAHDCKTQREEMANIRLKQVIKVVYMYPQQQTALRYGLYLPPSDSKQQKGVSSSKEVNSRIV